MKRKFAVLFLLLTLPLCADGPAEDNSIKYVGQASQESVRIATSKRWQNIAIAAGITAIAITTLVLVAKHHKHH